MPLVSEPIELPTAADRRAIILNFQWNMADLSYTGSTYQFTATPYQKINGYIVPVETLKRHVVNDDVPQWFRDDLFALVRSHFSAGDLVSLQFCCMPGLETGDVIGRIYSKAVYVDGRPDEVFTTGNIDTDVAENQDIAVLYAQIFALMQQLITELSL